MTNSPRSVSYTSTPAAARASFTSISSVVIDFDFTTVSASASAHTDCTYWFASAASSATYTLPPFASTASRTVSTRSGRFAIASALIALAADRRAS